MMPIPLTTIAALIAGIAGLGLLLDTVEVIRGRHALAEWFDGPMVSRRTWIGGWSVTSLRMIAALIAHVLVAAGTVCLLFFGSPFAAVGAVIVGAARWTIESRFAGSGTSATRLQIITWLTLALFVLAAPSETAQVAALSFLAFQGLVGYMMAGFEKLKNPFWVDGTAIRRILESDTFGAPRAAALLPLGLVSAPISWGTIAFEIVAPMIALVGPDAALLFCGIGLLFHVGVALMMGITQFIFSFGATYPALYVSVVWLHENLL